MEIIPAILTIMSSACEAPAPVTYALAAVTVFFLSKETFTMIRTYNASK